MPAATAAAGAGAGATPPPPGAMSARDKAEYARMFREKTVLDKRQMAIERRAGSPARALSPARGPPAAARPPPAPRTRVLTLNHDEHQESTLYRFEKGDMVQFCPGPTLLGRQVFLYTNYVNTENQEEAEFVRNQYYLLRWRRGAGADMADGAAGAAGADGAAGAAGADGTEPGALITDTDMRCELRLRRAGAFHFYWLYETERGGSGPAGSGWLQVSPALSAGGRAVPLAAVCCQTVLAKCLGPLSRWEATLQVARDTGYNMIHFTPVQALGASGSGYSLADQLKLNPAFSEPARAATFADLDNLLNMMRNEWKMLSICDVVLNHTANETPWLQQHPEAGYSVLNTPRLRPAALLDAALARFSTEVSLGHYEHRGIPRRVNEECHLEAIQHVLATEVVPALRLHELVTCHVDDLLHEFTRLARAKVPPVARAEPAGAGEAGELRLLPDPQWRRLQCRVDMERALQLYNVYWPDCYDEETRVRRCSEQLRRALERLCRANTDQLDAHLRAAINNARAGIRYFRVQPDGPRLEEVTENDPLLPRYFTWPAGALASLESAAACVYGEAGALVLAHNGWVMGGDPLQDFALQGDVYLRRELIAWGDSVKLRYGSKPEDSPFLWAHMREYVELTAELFDGLRLDNCHSTPLHVAEYMLDCARNVKPELFVVAELFTDSPHVDNMFVNRLGITALIREALSAWDAHELGRQVHRFSPRCVGAFLPPAPPAPHPARAALPPALLMDLTHDNPSPIEKRSVYDLLPTAALVCAARAASGSTRGYDELVPHHIHVVDERRLYRAAAPAPAPAPGAEPGMQRAKRALNQLHQHLAQEGFDEVYVDQMDPDIVAVTRHEPRTRQSVIIVAFTAFHPPAGGGVAGGGAAGVAAREPPALRFEGELDEIVLEAELVHTGGAEYVRDPQYINGLPDYSVRVREHVPLAGSEVFRGERREGEHTVLDWRPWRPGSVVVVRVSLRAEAARALAALQATCSPRAAPSPPPPGLAPLLQDLSLDDLNVLLYRCDAEERDAGGGMYEVPGHGPLVYGGLQGVASLLAEVTPAHALGHALCAHLRAGDWLPEHAWRRLAAHARLRAVADWYRESLAPLRQLPRYLHPAYFAGWVHNVHGALQQACISRCSEFVRSGSSLTRALALTSVQLCGETRGARLPAPSPALPPPWPPSTLSAGLPHFAAGYMRCWGRDTFVALRGLLVLPGRMAEARAHLLAFAACLRHGLIPNLLDGGTRARFNCRDAVWWWLQALQQYCAATPDGRGGGLLREPVARLFPRDDAAPQPPGAADQPLCDTIQEALDTHFQGLVFRERNAGRDIDAHMTDKGFNVQIGIDPETGFPFGGNDANCGTWMDKMGSSDAAGTRGKPATPRDGSAIELVALAYSAACWLAELHAAGHYPHAGVARAHRGPGPHAAATAWTWRQWAERIHNNFERHFWVGEAGDAAETRPDLVHRRNIYKDTVGASAPWADYQLRCNMVVALGIAPALCSPRRAWAALDTAQRHLLAPLGLKTLDPADWNYVGNYDNSNNSTDPKVSHGFNYHQGPEWGWPLGYYLRARLHFAHDNGCYVRTVSAVLAALGPLQAEIARSPWRSLPELCNEGGQPCRDSCASQAWSTATILEVLHELRAWQRVRPLPAAD